MSGDFHGADVKALQEQLAAKDAEIARLEQLANKRNDRICELLQDLLDMRTAAGRAKGLISYAEQNRVSSAVAESNRNQAWHVLAAALKGEEGK